MADVKNFASIDTKKIYTGNQEIKNNQENIGSPEKGEIFDNTNRAEQVSSGVSEIVNSSSELSGVQPIGGFASSDAKRQKEIENIMSQDLRDVYLQLTPDKQREFKIKGEETAKEINFLLNKAKLEIGKIIDLLRRWLFIIPGVNKFFIEQEVKIKADEIVRLKS